MGSFSPEQMWGHFICPAVTHLHTAATACATMSHSPGATTGVQMPLWPSGALEAREHPWVSLGKSPGVSVGAGGHWGQPRDLTEGVSLGVTGDHWGSPGTARGSPH